MAISLGRSLLSSLLSSLGTGGGEVRDYAHAAKTFRPNNFANAGRTKYLFHVFFNINPNISRAAALPVSTLSYLVKSIELPKYQIDLKEQNQYNRKKLVQTKIKYQPISIIFHDDNAGQIRNLWREYYNYYYADGRYSESAYTLNTKNNYPFVYADTLRGKWGLDAGSKEDFFTSIEIHSFHAGQDQKIVILNPYINSFSHDSHDYSENNTLMQNTMQISYTAVKYTQGYYTGAAGFGDPYTYDTAPSSLSGQYAGNVFDNQGNPFFPGPDYIDGYDNITRNNGAINAQNFAYDNLNKFTTTAPANFIADQTLAQINRSNGRYIFPSMNLDSLQDTAGYPINNNVLATSEGTQLNDNRQFFGNFPTGSWQKTLEDQGYDPRQIIDAEELVNIGVSQGLVSNNADALLLATEYFNNSKGSNETITTINNSITSTITPSSTEATYKAVNWQQELQAKGYSDEDIKFASAKLDFMQLNLEDNTKLTLVAEDIINRKSYYNFS